HGDRDAREAYERGRIIAPETLPEWASARWRAEATAGWRTLDLHGPKFAPFARKVRSPADKKFTHITIAPYDPEAPEPETGVTSLRDERASFLTYGNGRQLLLLVQEREAYSQSRRMLYALADAEIRQGFRLF